jgi:hypothetical protein
MKKSVLLLFISFVSMQLFAQSKEYVEFFFGTVKNANVESHIKNEKATFAKIHADRIKRGEILGWDMWQLVSPGESKDETTFLYATVYSDMEKANLLNTNSKDYIKRAAGENTATFTKTVNSVLADYTTMNDIATVVKTSDAANGTYDAKGNNAKIKYLVLNEMVVDPYRAGDYEKMEAETFKPYRKQNEKLQGWGLQKILNVYGKDKVNYYTVDFYPSLKDIYDVRENTTNYSEENIKALKDIEKVRTMKNAYIFELIDSKR